MCLLDRLCVYRNKSTTNASQLSRRARQMVLDFGKVKCDSVSVTLLRNWIRVKISSILYIIYKTYIYYDRECDTPN